ncbi:sugar-binding protein [Maribacter sp.]|uniref:sugar-binding protein n=1 Tax=Maribacter sp. TaxID=1897614 RepID=UPI0025C27AB0|nr:sugar-binding protein [Maribacter sp.]
MNTVTIQDNKTKKYNVLPIKADCLKITGKGIDQNWKYAEVLSEFVSPWDKKEIRKIEFRSLYDTKTIFFYFKVEDSKVYIDTSDNKISNINNSDRVELFFRSSKSMDPYYCLEIDPDSRIMDFMARPNKQFDFDWNWPANDITVKSSIEATFFTVEIGISISSLKKFGLLRNGEIETGIFRAKYNKKEGNKYQPTWITWVDPKTENPNFHTPSSFGMLKLHNF